MAPTPSTPPPGYLSIPEAGWKYLRLRRGAAYGAARRGELPILRIGSKDWVPIAAMERWLVDPPTPKPRPPRNLKRLHPNAADTTPNETDTKTNTSDDGSTQVA
jgi:hypothetical protein